MRTMTALALMCALICGAAVTAASAVEIKPGIITISLGSDVDTIDPHASSSAIGLSINRFVFDTLTHRPKGAVKAVPWAAESIRLVDPTTYEFKMREGVKFTNGEDVDAEVGEVQPAAPAHAGLS